MKYYYLSNNYEIVSANFKVDELGIPYFISPAHPTPLVDEDYLEIGHDLFETAEELYNFVVERMESSESYNEEEAF